MTSLHQTIISLFRKRNGRVVYRLQNETGGYRSVTFEEAADQALRLSSYLRSKGVRAGDRVLLVSENGPEWPIAALAVLNLRAVLVPVAAIGSNQIGRAHV